MNWELLLFVIPIVYFILVTIIEKFDIVGWIISGLLILIFIMTYWLSIDFKCWVNQKIRHTDSYAGWHLGQIYDAVKDDDLEDVMHLTHNMGEWIETLDENEMKIFDQAVKKWENEHPYRLGTIEDFYREHRDVLDK